MPKLLIVGWDAADWKVIRPLLAKGEMPHLAALIREGVSGNLSTIHPPLSPMVWTSIATGKRPYKHGIHGFAEPTADGLSIRPISNLGRKTKAFWNILNQNGKRSIVTGWWPSHPAEPIRGAMVSDLFPFRASSDPSQPMLKKTVWPANWESRLAELRVHPTEVPGEILRLFIPEWQKIDQSKDKSLHDLASIIAETWSIHAAATDLMEHEEWDCAAIYYCGIDHFSHRFMRYHAPRHPRGGGENAELFSEVVPNAYRYHDVMLGRLMALAGRDAAVVVLSDHGFHSDRLLPGYIPAEAAGPAVEHREFGIFCMKAPGVLRNETIYGANVLDLAPTVLHLFGLPAGADMDGKVLINAFVDRGLPEPVESWDEIEGEDGCHAPDRQYDGAAAVEALKQLVDLGYIAAPPEDTRKAVAECLIENRYNLAQAYLGGNYPARAAEILRDLATENPDQARFHMLLIECYCRQGDLKQAKNALEHFETACAEFVPRARREYEQLTAKRRAQHAETEINPAEIQKLRLLAEQAAGYQAQRLLLCARLALEEAGTSGDKAHALEVLNQLAAAQGRNSELALFLGEGFASFGEYDRALGYVRRARRADPDDWRAINLEARVHYAAGRCKEAVESGIASLSLTYFQPSLHYLLGLSFRRLGEAARADQEFRVALVQQPDLAEAHWQRADIAKEKGKTRDAALHMAQARVVERRAKLSAPVTEDSSPAQARGLEHWDGSLPDRSRAITVVAGLPRSGTSMMMRVLGAAGIDLYTDGVRTADSDNPRGYFEHEQATRLQQDASWMPQVRGKAVKVVTNLVPCLPGGQEYRIVFMLRPLEEVIASQRAMLDRLGRRGAALGGDHLARTYAGQLVRLSTWLSSRPEIQVLTVDYGGALNDPGATVARLAAFLGEPFDERAAVAAIEPALRRQVRCSGSETR